MQGIKVILLFMTLMLTGSNMIYAQEDTALNSALEKMTQATINKNYDELIHFLSPRLIKLMGGEVNTIAIFKKANERLTKDGIKVERIINYSKLKGHNGGSFQFKIIPRLIIVSSTDKTHMKISSIVIIAIKDDEKIGWKFIDLSEIEEDKISLLIPEFENSFSIPKRLFEDEPEIPIEELDDTIAYIMSSLDEIDK